MESLLAMRGQAAELCGLLSNGHCDVERFGALLDSGWQLKRGLAGSITTDQIDRWYQQAVDTGAYGGKLCGAGGGGFLLFVAPAPRHPAIRQALPDLREVSVRPEVHGSHLLLVE
jgi:D-glycero-alpha-D-manno-heptose-7-phosphate kinase